MTILGVGYSIHAEAHDFSDLGPALDEAERHGVDTVELPVYAMNLVAGGRILAPRLADLAGRLADRPYAYTVHGVLALNFMDETCRLDLHEQVARANIEITAKLGARHLVIHTGFCRSADAQEIDAAYERQRESLAALGDVAADHDVILCVENVFAFDGRHTALPSRLAAELALIDHPNVRATLDFSHGALNCAWAGVDFVTEAKALAPYAKHLHIHDSFGRPETIWAFHASEKMALGLGDLHLPLGYGNLPWDALMAECRFPEETVFNIELNQRFWPELADTIARTRDLAARATTGSANTEAARAAAE